jgi:hypothetical protein
MISMSRVLGMTSMMGRPMESSEDMPRRSPASRLARTMSPFSSMAMIPLSAEFMIDETMLAELGDPGLKPCGIGVRETTPARCPSSPRTRAGIDEPGIPASSSSGERLLKAAHAGGKGRAHGRPVAQGRQQFTAGNGADKPVFRVGDGGNVDIREPMSARAVPMVSLSFRGSMGTAIFETFMENSQTAGQ